ncbi:MAG: NAD-dependent protein deacylase [Symploca sp. SIO2D2]|nr:NAD-dependent protein deacylase [Symploca sp. SIO2D2]
MDNILSAVADCLEKAESILFIAGAGLSADSGLPTYRGVGGLFEGVLTQEGIPIEEAISNKMLQTRPEVTWKYLWQIGAACHKAKFNRAHEVIAQIESWKPDTWVLTQNIDGFERDAGSKNLIEVHGRLSELYCVDCSYRTTAEELLAGYSQPMDLPPKCPVCGGLIRPDIELFGEHHMSSSEETFKMLDNATIDLIFLIGTSRDYPYITKPLYKARGLNRPIVEINPAETALSEIADYHIRSTAADTLDKLWGICEKRQGS